MLINIDAEYTIQYNALLAGTKSSITGVQIIFPADSGLKKSSSTASCVTVSSSNVESPATCSIDDSGGQVKALVTGLTSGQPQYNLKVKVGLVNSNVGKTVYNIVCNSCSDGTCSSPIQSKTGLKLTYTPASVSGVTNVTASLPNNGWTNSSIKIEFKVTNPFCVNGIVWLKIPKANTNYLSLGASVGVSLLYGTDTVGAFTATLSTGNQGSTSRVSIPTKNLQLSKDFETGFDALLIETTQPSEIIAGQMIDIVLSPVRNPPSMNPVSGFVVRTGQAMNQWIDMTTDKIEFQTTKPGEFQNQIVGADSFISKVEIENNQTMVATANVNYIFTVYPTNDVPRKSSLSVQFPSTWQLDCAQKISVSCSQGCAFTDQYISCDAVSNSYFFLMGFEGQYDYLGAPGPIKFTIKGLTNPETTAQKTFTVTTYNVEGNNFPIDQSSSLFSLTYTTGTITVNSIKCNDPEINLETGTWTINMTAQHTFKDYYLLRIAFPTELKVQSLPKCNVIGDSSINAAYSCNADTTFNQIVIVKLYTPQLAAGKNFAFTINGITNPVDYIDPGTAKFTIEDSVSGGMIDEGSYKFGTNLFSKSYIDFFTAIANDLTNGKFPVRYSFQVIPRSKIAQGAYLILEMPTEVKPSSVYFMEQSCLTQKANDLGFSNTLFACRYDSSNNQMKIYDGFIKADSPQSPPQLNWYFDYLINPRGLITSGMFNITIYNKNDRVLFQNINPIGPNVTMTQLPVPKQFTYTRNNYTNGIDFDLTFLIKTTNFVEANDVLKLVIPRPLHFTDGTICRGDGYWAKGILECTQSGDKLTVEIKLSVNGHYNVKRRLSLEDSEEAEEEEGVLPKILGGRRLGKEQFIPANSLMLITLTNISSTESLRPVQGLFDYSLTAASGSPLEKAEYTLTFQNTEASQMDPNKAGVSPNLWDEGQLSNYTITFFPVNYEMNMYVDVFVNRLIGIPNDFGSKNTSCLGIIGTSKQNLSCSVNRDLHMIRVKDAFDTLEVKPDMVKFIFWGLTNPTVNKILDSWTINTYTHDGYGIDKLLGGMKINFFCEYPCATCDQKDNTKCYSCYGTSVSKYVYFWKNECLDNCPMGQYETYKNITNHKNKQVEAFTCDYCKSPCKTCGDNATDCLTCEEGWLWYDVDHTCYQVVEWNFPFVGACGLLILINWLLDCCFRNNKAIRALLFWLSFLEDAVIGFWLWRYYHGEVPGDRTVAFVSFISHVSLNTLFIFVHICGIARDSTPQYKELRKSFAVTYYSCNCISYILNFKISLILTSICCNSDRYSGKFSSDNWQKFNIFSALYILLVYIVFIGDFYLFFTNYGIRNLNSYISGELVVIQTIISLLLLLEILNYCTCGGLIQKDFGKRVGLYEKSKKIKRRKAKRQGMGNSESSYDSEDESEELDDDELKEYEIYLEEQRQKLESLGTEESQISNKQIQLKDKSMDNSTSDLLGGDLNNQAKQMRKKREQEQQERADMLKKEQDLLKNQNTEEEDPIKRTETMKKQARKEIERQLEHWGDKDGSKSVITSHRSKKDDQVPLPDPISKRVEVEKEIDGEEEYWIQQKEQNQTVTQRSLKKMQSQEKDISPISYQKRKSDAMTKDKSRNSLMKNESSVEFNQKSGTIRDNELTSQGKNQTDGGRQQSQKSEMQSLKKQKTNQSRKQNGRDSARQLDDKSVEHGHPSERSGKKLASQRSQISADRGDVTGKEYQKSKTDGKYGSQKSLQKGKVSNRSGKQDKSNYDDAGDRLSAEKGNVSIGDQYDKSQHRQNLENVSAEKGDISELGKYAQSQHKQNIGDNFSAEKGDVSELDKYAKSQHKQNLGENLSAEKGGVSDIGNYDKSQHKQNQADGLSAEKGDVSEIGKYDKSQHKENMGDNLSAEKGDISNLGGKYDKSMHDFNNGDQLSAEKGDVSNRELQNSSRKQGLGDNMSAEKGDVTTMGDQNQKQGFGDNISGEHGVTNDQNYDKSKGDSFRKNSTIKKSKKDSEGDMDQEGHSDESNEDAVANHDPFNGIQEALKKQEEMRKDVKPPETTSQEGDEIIEAKQEQTPINSPQSVGQKVPIEALPVEQKQQVEDIEPEDEIGNLENENIENPNSGRRRVKQVLYSDKSESSVDEMMEDTPSNYNIANGRLEGKSMGLKAILIYAKNQGIKLADNPQPLPQIQEAANSSGEEKQWKSMNEPLEDRGNSQMMREQAKKQNQDDDHRSSKRGTQKRPDVQKQFLEEQDDDSINPLKKNNFV